MVFCQTKSLSTVLFMHNLASLTSVLFVFGKIIPYQMLQCVKCILAPSGVGYCPFYGSGSVVVDSLLIVTPIWGFYSCSMFCCALLCVHSSFAFHLMGKRELVALLSLSLWCIMVVVLLFLAIS